MIRKSCHYPLSIVVITITISARSRYLSRERFAASEGEPQTPSKADRVLTMMMRERERGLLCARYNAVEQTDTYGNMWLLIQ